MHRRRFLHRIASSALGAGLSIPASAQTDLIEDEIRIIRSDYNEIERLPLQSIQFEFEAEDDPTFGTLTRYEYDGVTVKILLSYSMGDHGGADETYYYRDGELFFVYAAESMWSFTGRTKPDGQSETVDTLHERRLYVAKGNLIRHLEKTAKSSDPGTLTKLIRKETNQAAPKSERTDQILRRGQRALGARTPAQLGAILFGE